MNVSRRDFFSLLGTGAAAVALPGCVCPCATSGKKQAKTALQLYSIGKYIGGTKDKAGKIIKPGVGLERALADVAAIGYKGVEFAGYYGFDAKALKKMLDDNGLKACGTHVGVNTYGIDLNTWKYDAEVLKQTCDFNMTYGNNVVICPGGAGPKGINWTMGRDGTRETMTPAQQEHTKKLCDIYNRAAADAAKFGCRIGLHNHMWEHGILMSDGTSFWDYFFANTDSTVCMEQDVGWSTCAAVDPAVQYKKYPHRSPTLHAKENGMGKDVKKFDAILGQPGKPGAVGVDWDKLIVATEKDGVDWYVVECEEHFEDLSAVMPSYNFLRGKGII